jgi:hypothetical protein
LTPYKRAIYARYQTVDFGLLCESVLNKNLKHLQFLFSVVHDLFKTAKMIPTFLTNYFLILQSKISKCYRHKINAEFN